MIGSAGRDEREVNGAEIKYPQLHIEHIDCLSGMQTHKHVHNCPVTVQSMKRIGLEIQVGWGWR